MNFKNNYKKEWVHKSVIKHGDIIILHDKVITVDRKYIKSDGFMGLTLYGDTLPFMKGMIQRFITGKGGCLVPIK